MGLFINFLLELGSHNEDTCCPWLDKHDGLNDSTASTMLKHLHRDHFVNAPSQWETMLQCNVISHWLGACTKWSLLTVHTKNYAHELNYVVFGCDLVLVNLPISFSVISLALRTLHGYPNVSEATLNVMGKGVICLLRNIDGLPQDRANSIVNSLDCIAFV